MDIQKLVNDLAENAGRGHGPTLAQLAAGLVPRVDETLLKNLPPAAQDAFRELVRTLDSLDAEARQVRLRAAKAVEFHPYVRADGRQ